MFINKIGFEHVLYGVNCQDFGTINGNKKCVVDGCSESHHSEVGAKLFIHLFLQEPRMDRIFEKLTSIFALEEQIKNYLLFTILYLEEDDERYVVYECGDGYIIKQSHDDKIEYQKIDYDGMPPYYAYNYISRTKLGKYQGGVQFNTYEFSKKDYKSIGISTDGLSYILNSQYLKQFENYLVKRKSASINRLININHNFQYAVHTLPQELVHQYIPSGYSPSINNFKDDITLVI